MAANSPLIFKMVNKKMIKITASSTASTLSSSIPIKSISRCNVVGNVETEAQTGYEFIRPTSKKNQQCTASSNIQYEETIYNDNSSSSSSSSSSSCFNESSNSSCSNSGDDDDDLSQQFENFDLVII